MIGLRIADITAAEHGTWQPRRAWQHFDAAVRAGGILVRARHLHDCQHSSPPHHTEREEQHDRNKLHLRIPAAGRRGGR